jgi:hypothetical protein
MASFSIITINFKLFQHSQQIKVSHCKLKPFHVETLHAIELSISKLTVYKNPRDWGFAGSFSQLLPVVFYVNLL